MCDELLKKAVEEAIGPTAQAAAGIVTNTTQPLTKGIGSTLGDLWFLVFGGISHAADKRRAKYGSALKAYESELSNEIDKIPLEKRTEPNTQVAMNALADSQYCVEEPILRTMFCKLLASASSSDTAHLTHPIFSAIIKRMAPFDADLLMRLAPHGTLPIVCIRLENIDKEGYMEHTKHVLAVNGTVLEDTKLVAASLDVLQSLGLISIDYQQHLVGDNYYEPFEKCRLYKDLQLEIEKNHQNEHRLKLQRGILSMTDLGTRFISVCT